VALVEVRAEVLAQLWGPVVTDPTSIWLIGCTRPTNNTAEVTGMAEGLELIDQRPAGNTYAILFDSMYAANVAEGNWTAQTNVEAASRTVALLAEVRRRNDIHPIHVMGHWVHVYPGNEIAVELAWWGKEPPPPPRSAGCGREEEKGRASTGRRQTTRRAGGGARRRRRRLDEGPLLAEMLWRTHERPLR
jgi:ribonuclease HI